MLELFQHFWVYEKKTFLVFLGEINNGAYFWFAVHNHYLQNLATVLMGQRRTLT